MTKHVCVLMGGLSSERDVSLSSGAAVVNALESLNYRVSTIDPDSSVSQKICDINPDIVFNALHGTMGEDGCIQGVLNYLNIPYTHSGLATSAIAMDKNITKLIATSLDIRCPEGTMISGTTLLANPPSNFPYIIKPNKNGSSVDVYLVRTAKDIPEQLSDDDYLIETYIPGKELSVAVCNNKALGVIELNPNTSFFDYEAKYTDGSTEHIYPAQIPDAIYQEALNSAESIHRHLNCHTISRSDFRYDTSTGKLYFLEVNTHPGLTTLSLLPDIAAHNGITFNDLVELLISQAQCGK